MKIFKSLVLISCLLSTDLAARSVSFSVRNLSGAPIIGGKWKWNNDQIADIQGVTPIAPNALQGWAWWDEYCISSIALSINGCTDWGHLWIKQVVCVRQETDPVTKQKVAITTLLDGAFERNWDFAILPGGKIIKVRNYGDSYDDTAGRYVHPYFPILYSGTVRSVMPAKVIMEDGKTYFGNVKQIVQPTLTTAGKVIFDDGREAQGIVKEIFTGKVVFTDGTIVLGDGTVTR